jgi:hypothetical protein
MKKKLLLFILLFVLFLSGCTNPENPDDKNPNNNNNVEQPDKPDEPVDPKHEHVVCPECGKCTDPECDGRFSEKCPGHNEEPEQPDNPDQPDEPDLKDNVTLELEKLTISEVFNSEFTLPATLGETGIAIVWETSDPTVLSTEGYSYVQNEDVKVTVTATITVEGQEYQKEFEV